jgi:hypothetical protein
LGAWIIATVVLATLAFWLGETPVLVVAGWLMSVYAPYLFIAAIALPLLLVPLFAVAGIRRKLTIGIAPIVIAAAFVGGFESYLRATDDALARCGEVQAALDQSRDTQGQYPSTLADLGMDRVPGKRIFCGSVLDYSTDGSRYSISFLGRLGRFHATAGHAIYLDK